MSKQICFACYQIPENLLQLSCDHCICLPCAAKHIEVGRTNRYFITCIKCMETTQLQEQIFQQLAPYERTSLPKKQQIVLNKGIVRNALDSQSNTNNLIERFCASHKQFQMMYVCKTCNDIFICPQCLINGSHKNHEAIVVQKEGERIKNKLQQDLAKINKKVSELEKMESVRLANIEQRKEQLLRLRSLAIKQYQEIKQAISREENTVISKCSQLIASHQREETNFCLEIAAQIESLQYQKIHLVDILNPLLEERTVGNSKSIQKIMMMNLIKSYKTLNSACQRSKQYYVRNAEQHMEEDQLIDSLTKKIENINIRNFCQANQKRDDQRVSDLEKIMQNAYNRKMERNLLNKKQIHHKNDFFNLL